MACYARDNASMRYLSVINIDGGVPLVNICYHELTVDPDLLAGFVTAVIIFAKTPIRTIRKAAYDILIEVGRTKMVMIVTDPVDDESSYRDKMKQVLDFAEALKIEPNHNYTPKSILSEQGRTYPPWLRLFVFHCLLSMKGFSWIGLLDVNPNIISHALLSSTISAQANSIFQDYLLPQLCSQIDKGGTTIGLDVQRMTQHGDLAKRIDDVLKHRKNEVNDLNLFYDGQNVNLEPLWLTVYGNQVLNVLSLGLSCSKDDFSTVRDKFRELGYKLRITQNKRCSTRSTISDGMREFILRRWNSTQFPSFDLDERMIRSIIHEIMK